MISFKSLGVDKGEWLEDVEHRDIVIQLHILACVEECISERESRFEVGLTTKVKLDIYKRFGKM